MNVTDRYIPPVGNPYEGAVKFSFDPLPGDDPGKECKGLEAHIYTENLHLRSVQACDVDNYCNLFGNAEVVKTYGDGNPWARDRTEARVNIWVDRWNRGDPYSGYAVFKADSDGAGQDETFLGHAVLGSGNAMAYDDNPNAGYSEMAGLGHVEYHNKGYARQAIAALVNGAVPEYKKAGCLVPTFCQNKEAKPLELPLTWITATAARDNEASVRLLTGVGFEFKKAASQENRTGGKRDYFALKV